MSRVRFTGADGREKVVSLADFGGQLTIGRTPDCAVYANSLSVSRNHAQIWLDGEQVRISDLGSSNGTFVNGRKIEEQVLTSGDLIKCGEFTLVYESDEPLFEGDDPVYPAEEPLPTSVPHNNLSPMDGVGHAAEGMLPAEAWEDLRQKEEEIERLRSILAEMEEKLGSAEERIRALEDDLTTAQAQSQDALAARASLEQEFETAQEEIASLSAQLKETQDELAQLRMAPPPAPDGDSLEELQLRQEIISLKEELYRLRRAAPKS